MKVSKNVDSELYSDIEEQFRGSRKEVKRRQSTYLPLLEVLGTITKGSPCIDVGCGRGEWLEILSENGYRAIGIDINKKFIAAGKKRGLDIQKAEALSYLREIPDASVSVVSSFHLVEHLPYPTVCELLKEIHRALCPGGIVIVETPNPENITVGSCNFYYDPTHLAPIPPALLQFTVEQGGFKSSFVAGLNADLIGPPIGYLSDETPSSLQLNGAIHLVNQYFYSAPDYAVIGQKKGGEVRLENTDELNELCKKNMNVMQYRELEAERRTIDAEAKVKELETLFKSTDERRKLAERHGAELGSRVMSAEARAKIAEAHGAELGFRVQSAEERAHIAETHCTGLNVRVREAEEHSGKLEQRALVAEQQVVEIFAHAQALDHRINEILNSHSWKITAPFRLGIRSISHPIKTSQLLVHNVRVKTKGVLKFGLSRGAQIVVNNPKYMKAARSMLRRFPVLEHRAYNLYRKSLNISSIDPNMQSDSGIDKTVYNISGLSKKAQTIYFNLLVSRQNNTVQMEEE